MWCIPVCIDSFVGKDRLGSYGLTLHELAVLAATWGNPAACRFSGHADCYGA